MRVARPSFVNCERLKTRKHRRSTNAASTMTRFYVNRLNVNELPEDDAELSSFLWAASMDIVVSRLGPAHASGPTSSSSASLVGRGIALGAGTSVYVGTAGYGLALWSIADALAGPNARALGLRGPWGWTAARLCEEAWSVAKPAPAPAGGRHPRVTMLEGAAGPLAVRAATATRLSRDGDAASAVSSLVSLEPDVEALPPGDCEPLYGRTGYAHALLFVAQHGTPNARVPLLAAARRTLVVTLAAGASTTTTALSWSWHGRHYLGAAHGTAGILLATLNWATADTAAVGGGIGDVVASLESDAGVAPGSVGATITDWLHQQEETGDWPSSVGSDRTPEDALVQFCHGAPGALLLIAQAVMVIDSGGDLMGWPTRAALIAAAESAAEATWARGLLKKGPGLCHGWAGNCYGLLAAYRATGNAVHLQRARAMAVWGVGAQPELEILPDRPFSLYEGLGGAAVLLAELAVDPRAARLPGSEL